MLQGDMLYDMVERSDVDIVQSNLDIENNLSSGKIKDFEYLFKIVLCDI